MTKQQRSARKGTILPLVAVVFPVMLAFAGLAVDMALVYLVDTQLATATDAAVLAATRSDDSSHGSLLAYSVFAANFPAGDMLTTSSQLTNLQVTSTSASAVGVAVLPTFFMRIIGKTSVTVRNRALAEIVPANAASNMAEMILIDEDGIDNDMNGVYSDPDLVTIEDISLNRPPWCGKGDPAKCVNDDIADVGQRRALFTRGRDVTNRVTNLVLHTGQLQDEGFFYFANADPQVSNQNGATFTRKELFDFCYSFNSNGNCTDDMDENDLDKVAGVRPMRQTEIEAMVGKTYCALVYDSDISRDDSKDEASLKGSTMGVTAFSVTGTVKPPECGNNLPGTSACSYLSHVIVDLIPSGDILTVCNQFMAAGSAPPMSANRVISLK